eukprot:8764138-Pyramimonas_sp.AAC.1
MFKACLKSSFLHPIATLCLPCAMWRAKASGTSRISGDFFTKYSCAVHQRPGQIVDAPDFRHPRFKHLSPALGYRKSCSHDA